MSRQICFVHSEIDVIRFVAKVLKRRCSFIDVNSHCVIMDPECIIIEKMSTDFCGFLIIPDGGDVTDAIEFDNCFRCNELSRTYEVGRLYISDGCSHKTLKAYNELKKFIKMNYAYCKTNRIYFGQDFLDKHLKNFYYATNGMTQIVRFS